MKTDHYFHTLQPCFQSYQGQKDLRISYLEQYENNGFVFRDTTNYPCIKDRSKSTLKNITDKYGFFWDQTGKLAKKHQQRQLYARGKQNKYQRDVNERYQRRQLYPDNNFHHIEDRIHRIVDKYEKHNNISNGYSPKLCKCDHQKHWQKSDDAYERQFERKQNNFDDQTRFVRSKSENKLMKLNQTNISHNFNEKETLRKINKQDKSYEIKKSISKTDLKRNFFRQQEKNGLRKHKQNQIDSQIERINAKIRQFEKHKQNLKMDFVRFNPKSVEKPKRDIQQNRQQNFVISKTASQNVQSNKIKVQSQDERMNFQNKKVKDQYRHAENIEQKDKSTLLFQLVRQIELNQQFRNAKLWFENNSDPHKWGILSDKLSAKGINFTYFELVKEFGCLSQQHNSFFSSKCNDQNYSSLVSLYLSNQKHWNEKIKNCFTKRDLLKQKFTEEELDVEQKGYINMEDLVGYVNMRNKSFYGGRDFVILFKKFTRDEQITQVCFQKILHTLLK